MGPKCEAISPGRIKGLRGAAVVCARGASSGGPRETADLAGWDSEAYKGADKLMELMGWLEGTQSWNAKSQ